MNLMPMCLHRQATLQCTALQYLIIPFDLAFKQPRMLLIAWAHSSAGFADMHASAYKLAHCADFHIDRLPHPTAPINCWRVRRRTMG
jgi:hypothetical protein